MPNNIRKLFGRNVRRLREAQGLTQEELAQKAGLNRSYLAGIEGGRRSAGMQNIERIAQALGITPDILFKDVNGGS